MKRIMSGKKALSKQDSKQRVDKVFNDIVKQVSPKNQVSPTARLNNTFGSKKVIK